MRQGLNYSRARHLRRNMTDAERKLWRLLRGRQMESYRFRRQQPIGNYIVDFVCLEARLVIEVDGGQHAIHADADRERTEWLRSEGYRVLRFWNRQVLKETRMVLDEVWRALQDRERDGNNWKEPPPPWPSPLKGEGTGGSPSEVEDRVTER